MARTTVAIERTGAGLLIAAVGCTGPGGEAGASPEAGSDAEAGPSRLSGAAECAVAGGQCEVGAVCGLEQGLNAGPCGPGGAVCCLRVLCAADATVQLIQASDYDASCGIDSDCVEVYVGNACSCQLSCQDIPATINKDALPQYTADVADAPRVVCGCPVRAPPLDGAPALCCLGGTCQFSSQCSNSATGADAAADAAAEAAAD